MEGELETQREKIEAQRQRYEEKKKNLRKSIELALEAEEKKVDEKNKEAKERLDQQTHTLNILSDFAKRHRNTCFARASPVLSMGA